MAKRDKSTRKAPQHNVACPNLMKVSAAVGCGGLQAEMEERLGQNTPNIDRERSKLNLYFLPDPEDRQKFVIQKEKPESSLEDRVYARIHEVGATVKRDTREDSAEPGSQKHIIPQDNIIMQNILMQVSHERAMEILEEDDMLDENGKIRSDKELPMGSKTMQMFIDSYKFAQDRYGAENVIGAYLHLDEYTPHMHLQVVPLECRPVMHQGKVCTNKKDGTTRMKWRLNNTKLFGKDEHKDIWKAYAEALKDYGVVAAEGLVPKGEYEKQATMEAIYRREQEKKEEIKQLDNQVNGLRWEQEQKERKKEQLEKENQELVKKLADMEARLAKAEKDVNAAVSENQNLQNSISLANELFSDIVTKETFEKIPSFVNEMAKNCLKKDAPYPLLNAIPVLAGPYKGNYIIAMDVKGTARYFWVDKESGKMFLYQGNFDKGFEKGFLQNPISNKKTEKLYIFSNFVKFMNRVPSMKSEKAVIAGMQERIMKGNKAPDATAAPARQSHGGGGNQPKPQKEKPINFGKGAVQNTPGDSSSKKGKWDDYDNLTGNKNKGVPM